MPVSGQVAAADAHQQVRQLHKQRRKVLSDVKNIVGKGKVPLNAQLVVEALGVKERRI